MATAEMELDVLAADELLHKYRNVRVSIERIGPAAASAYLKHNTKNRPLNKRHAERLRQSMADGDWWMNGETVIFSHDGTLLNGQHRLWAIVASGAEVDVLVVRGIDQHAFRTIDGVRARTTGDVLAIDNEKNANAVAGAISALVSFIDCGGTVSGSTSSNASRKTTASIASRVLAAHPGIRDSVQAMRQSKLFSNQFGFMLHYVFGLVDASLAAEFADVLANNHTDIGRPFVVFREHLIHHPNRTDLRRAHCAKAIKAFNAEVNGERPKMFKFSPGEEFPTIVGLEYEKLAESIG